MINDYWLIPVLIPNLPNDCDKPPTIYALLQSIINYGKDTPTKIKNLAKEGHSIIFNFDYPLTVNINKEDFESLILNHYLMRRIGFETLTAFQIQLMVKLNEIMPMYNKLFDSIKNWNLFEDGQEITHTSNNTVADTDTTNSTIGNNTTNTSDRRFSESPQNELDNIKDGKYVSEYNYDTDTNTVNGTNNINSTKNSNGTLSETTKITPQNKMELYKQFLESKQNIYTMIFKDLDCLFYQIVL